ncbi:hypothetical protein FO519_003932 [Halicephalobus sp. NKZ332]|nr:hypothetical protein FO519_003932 [Halicephalobus sp. NKZ332]
MMMKAIILFIFIFICHLQDSAGDISQATKNIVKAVTGECTQSKLKTYMQQGSSMDSAIGDILVYAPRINTGYICLMDNYDNAINAFIEKGSVGALIDYYAATCTSDSNLNSCFQILQNPDVQGRLGTVALTIFNPFTPEFISLINDIINEALDTDPVTEAEVQGYVQRFKALSPDTINGIITQIASMKQVLKSGGTYYKPYQNLLSMAIYIFGTATPTADQTTKANNALKKGCVYLHKNFNQYFYFCRNWLSAYPISTSVSMNLTAVSSFTASSAVLAGAATSFLKMNSTQQKIDDIFNECYSI